MFEKESGVPIPPESRQKGDFFKAIESLEIGDSFLCPISKRTMASRYGTLLRRKFTTRSVDSMTARIWRTA